MVSHQRGESDSQVDSDDDDYGSEDSEVESDDEDRSPSLGYPVKEVWSKFTKKYSKSHRQGIVLQDWHVFDKERARKLAKWALKNLKSGMNQGSVTYTRENEAKGRWVGLKNNIWGKSMGTRFVWPGGLPEFRLENIRREFVSWINTFGWEVEAVTFSVEDSEEKLEWLWIIKVPEDWQN